MGRAGGACWSAGRPCVSMWIVLTQMHAQENTRCTAVQGLRLYGVPGISQYGDKLKKEQNAERAEHKGGLPSSSLNSRRILRRHVMGRESGRVLSSRSIAWEATQKYWHTEKLAHAQQGADARKQGIQEMNFSHQHRWDVRHRAGLCATVHSSPAVHRPV